jgi:hypothetical protein
MTVVLLGVPATAIAPTKRDARVARRCDALES